MPIEPVLPRRMTSLRAVMAPLSPMRRPTGTHVTQMLTDTSQTAYIEQHIIGTVADAPSRPSRNASFVLRE